MGNLISDFSDLLLAIWLLATKGYEKTVQDLLDERQAILRKIYKPSKKTS